MWWAATEKGERIPLDPPLVNRKLSNAGEDDEEDVEQGEKEDNVVRKSSSFKSSTSTASYSAASPRSPVEEFGNVPNEDGGWPADSEVATPWSPRSLSRAATAFVSEGALVDTLLLKKATGTFRCVKGLIVCLLVNFCLLFPCNAVQST